jgi:hypothetical protein
MDSRDYKDIPIEIPENLFQDVWEHQEGLMMSYKVIENWPVDWPVNLNIKDSQLLVKDMVARTIEELAEGYESHLKGDFDNFYEELADAHHFLMETLILCDHPWVKIKTQFPGTTTSEDPLQILRTVAENEASSSFFNLEHWLWDVTYRLSLARNALRNKPWKQTQVMYNRPVFEIELSTAYIKFIFGYYLILNSERREPVKLYKDYILKNRVNKFRILSKY